jgi:putative ABC transport system permease protein
MESFVQDLRYVCRLLVKNPAFSLTLIFTLALGIGANASVFSVVNAVLLRSLPYEAADRLVVVSEAINKDPRPVAYPNFIDWRSENQVFEKLAAYSATDFGLMAGDRVERVPGEIVSDDYFSLLGVSAAEGRDFRPEEHSTPGAHPVVILSRRCWQNRFGASPGLVGGTVKVNEVSFTVVGIMPEGFNGFSGEAELWVPMMMRDALWPQTARFDFLNNRDVHWHRVLGRLRPGTSLERAQSDMETLAARLEHSYPKENANRGALVVPAKERLVGNSRAALLVLLGAVAFVLLIACANVANLLLAKSASRSREVAIRIAMGAGRGRLIRQLLTESTVIAVLGGVVGLLIALWGVELLVLILPVELPRFAAVRVDAGVLAFTFAVSVVTGLLLGLVPALQASRSNLNESLKEGARAGGAGLKSSRVQSLLVVSEMALAVMLMIGAGLMLQSFRHMRRAETGFRADHLLTMRFDVPNRKYTGAERAALSRQLISRIEGLPAVEAAAITYTDLFLWNGINRGFTIEGAAPVPAGEQDSVYFHDISPKFFETMGVPLLAGRDFTERDDKDAPRVAIVSHAFARRYWPGVDPLGKRFKYGPADSTQAWITVVGVAGDTRFRDLRHDPADDPVVYVPLLQSEVVISLNVVARTRVEPASLADALRAEIQSYDPEIPVYNIATAEQRIADQTSETEAYTLLMSLFAGLALLLAVVGIYGVMSCLVTQRTHEIGVRMALGAQRRHVIRLVVGRGLLLAAAGIVVGLSGALLLSRLIASLLYGVSAADPTTYLTISLLLAAVAAAACFIPAHRATKIDPLIALRHE